MSFNWPPGKNEARERLGEEFKQLQLESKLSTSRGVVPARADPLITPIYHSSTYRFQTVKQFGEENHGNNYVYQRCGNPTVENVEVVLNELEGGAATLLYNSGLSAASSVFLEFLNPGDHLICMKPMYSGTYSFLTETMTRFGVEISFVDVEKEESFVSEVENHIKQNTKMIFIEVIANPSMAVPDIVGTFELAQKKKIISFIDSTFASPYNIQPIKMGADFNMHSCSKYIGGHSDVIGGCVTTKSMDNWQRLKLQQLTMGSALSPWDASLLARGLKTLALRVDKINSSAQAIASHLEHHTKVAHVFYPGLHSHPQHKQALRAMKQFGGMIAFDLGSAEAAIALVENVRVIAHAVSLGGTESLIEHPGSMSHGSQLLRGDEKPMVQPGLLRLSIGVEATEDLIQDLDRALSFVE